MPLQKQKNHHPLDHDWDKHKGEHNHPGSGKLYGSPDTPHYRFDSPRRNAKPSPVSSYPNSNNSVTNKVNNSKDVTRHLSNLMHQVQLSPASCAYNPSLMASKLNKSPEFQLASLLERKRIAAMSVSVGDNSASPLKNHNHGFTTVQSNNGVNSNVKGVNGSKYYSHVGNGNGPPYANNQSARKAASRSEFNANNELKSPVNSPNASLQQTHVSVQQQYSRMNFVDTSGETANTGANPGKVALGIRRDSPTSLSQSLPVPPVSRKIPVIATEAMTNPMGSTSPAALLTIPVTSPKPTLKMNQRLAARATMESTQSSHSPRIENSSPQLNQINQQYNISSSSNNNNQSYTWDMVQKPLLLRGGIFLRSGKHLRSVELKLLPDLKTLCYIDVTPEQPGIVSTGGIGLKIIPLTEIVELLILNSNNISSFGIKTSKRFVEFYAPNAQVLMMWLGALDMAVKRATVEVATKDESLVYDNINIPDSHHQECATVSKDVPVMIPSINSGSGSSPSISNSTKEIVSGNEEVSELSVPIPSLRELPPTPPDIQLPLPPPPPPEVVEAMASMKYLDWVEIYQPILMGGETFLMPATYTRKVKIQLMDDLKTLNVCNNSGFDHSNVKRILLTDIESLVLKKELGNGAFAMKTASNSKWNEFVANNMEIRDRWVYAIRVAAEWAKHPLYEAILKAEKQGGENGGGITI